MRLYKLSKIIKKPFFTKSDIIIIIILMIRSNLKGKNSYCEPIWT